MAMEVAQVAAWEWNLCNGKMTWSTDPEAMFGLPHGALGSTCACFAPCTRRIASEPKPRWPRRSKAACTKQITASVSS